MSSTATHREMEGILVASDPQTRLLVIDANGTVLTISVSPVATVLLHGEPVRLRMLQVGDHVLVIADETPAGLVARSVEVIYSPRGRC